MELIDIKKYLSDFEIDYLNKVLLITNEPNALSKSMSVVSQHTALVLDSSAESKLKLERIDELVMLIKIFSREYEEKGKEANIFEFTETLQSCLDDFSPNSKMGKKAQQLLTSAQVNSTWDGVQQEMIADSLADTYEINEDDTMDIFRKLIQDEFKQLDDSDLKKVKKDISTVEFDHLDDDAISAIAYFIARKLDYVRKNNIRANSLNGMNKKALAMIALEYLTRHKQVIGIIVEKPTEEKPSKKDGVEPYDE